MNISITQLEYVLAVEEARHFGKAAKKCSVTQPTLSMQIQKLEEEIGSIIFDRSKKPVLITIEGEAFIQQARAVMREFNKLSHILKMEESGISGDFKLGVIPTLAPYLLPLFLAKFDKVYQHVNLIIEEMETAAIIENLENDKIDAGLLVTPLYLDSIIERVLFFEKFFLFTSKSSEFSQKKKISLDELGNDDMLILKEGHCFRNQVINFCNLKNSRDTRNRFRFESGNLETLIRMIEKGDGHTFVPELAIDGVKKRKGVVRELPNPAPVREVSLVYTRSFYKEKIINALEEVILSSLPDGISSHKKKEMDIIDI